MYNTKNEEFISWAKKLMIIGGFWDLPITHNSVLKTIFYAYSVFMRIGYLVFWVLLIFELVRLAAYNYDLKVIFASLSVVVNASKIATKILIYVKHNILQLFRNVIEKEQEIWQLKNEEINTLYRRQITICKIYVTSLGIATVMTVLSLQITGAAGMLQLKEYNEAYNKTIESHFMFQILLPLNKLDNLYLTFVAQALCTWVGITYNVITQLIFVVLLVNAATQLQVLQIRFRNYVEIDFNLPNQEEIDEKMMVLKHLILEHQSIIGFVQYFNKCTRNIIFIEFILSSLDMASVSTNLIKLETSEIGWLLFFLALLLLQIFLIGWTCNEIKVQSESIGDALYESKWYLLNKESRQLTQIVIARAQKPLLMTIGPFGPMTTNSALLVVKAAYSYVSIMKN